MGVECSGKAIEKFFSDNGRKFTKESFIYKDSNLPLTLLNRDFFTVENLLTDFDFIWDRAALIALNQNDRKLYAEILNQSLIDGGQILIELVEVDKNLNSQDEYQGKWAPKSVFQKASAIFIVFENMSVKHASNLKPFK